MGKYCKAYLARDLRAYPKWSENSENMEPQLVEGEGGDKRATPSITDETVLYIQDDYTVTDGIFKNEYVIFGTVTDEWITFCITNLGFVIPISGSQNAGHVRAESLEQDA